MKKIGIMVGIVALLTFTTVLLNAQAVRSILVSVKNIKLVVGGKNVAPAGSSIPTALDYNGTLYVPLRVAVQALNLPVKWDQKSQTVSIGSAVSTSSAYLSDLQPQITGALSPDEAVIANNQHPNPPSASQEDASWFPPMKINGLTFEKGISVQLFQGDSAQLSWQLGGKYSFLSGTLGLDAQTHSSSGDDQDAYALTVAAVTFSGDGRTLATIEIGGATTPSPVNIPISGVKVLTMQVQMQTDPDHLAMLDLVNPALR